MANTLAFRAVCAEPWAITADYLHMIAMLALRDRSHPMSMDYQARSNEGREPTPEERFATLFPMSAAARKLEGQGSGRAVVAGTTAVLPVLGPIFPRANMMTMSGGTSLTALQQDLRAALADEGVNSVMLAIDSPGGAVSGVASMGDAIFGARSRKPIAAHVSGTGASAAYWLASAADRVTMDRTAMVGSIGVIAGVPKQVQPDADGNMYIDIVSSNAPNKRPDPTDPEGLLEIRSSLDAIEAHFIADVAKGRGVSREKVLADFGKGSVFLGSEAVKRGMADAVSSFDAALAHIGRIGKLKGK